MIGQKHGHSKDSKHSGDSKDGHGHHTHNQISQLFNNLLQAVKTKAISNKIQPINNKPSHHKESKQIAQKYAAIVSELKGIFEQIKSMNAVIADMQKQEDILMNLVRSCQNMKDEEIKKSVDGCFQQRNRAEALRNFIVFGKSSKIIKGVQTVLGVSSVNTDLAAKIQEEKDVRAAYEKVLKDDDGILNVDTFKKSIKVQDPIIRSITSLTDLRSISKKSENILKKFKEADNSPNMRNRSEWEKRLLKPLQNLVVQFESAQKQMVNDSKIAKVLANLGEYDFRQFQQDKNSCDRSLHEGLTKVKTQLMSIISKSKEIYARIIEPINKVKLGQMEDSKTVDKLTDPNKILDVIRVRRVTDVRDICDLYCGFVNDLRELRWFKVKQEEFGKKRTLREELLWCRDILRENDKQKVEPDHYDPIDQVIIDEFNRVKASWTLICQQILKNSFAGLSQEQFYKQSLSQLPIIQNQIKQLQNERNQLKQANDRIQLLQSEATKSKDKDTIMVQLTKQTQKLKLQLSAQSAELTQFQNISQKYKDLDLSHKTILQDVARFKQEIDELNNKMVEKQNLVHMANKEINEMCEEVYTLREKNEELEHKMRAGARELLHISKRLANMQQTSLYTLKFKELASNHHIQIQQAAHYDSLFGSKLFEDRFELKMRVITHVETMKKARISRAKLIYKYSEHNTSSFHKYLNSKDNLFCLIKLVNGIYAAAFYSGTYTKKEKMRNPALLISITNNLSFPLYEFDNKSNRKVKGMTYDEESLIYGQSDLKIHFNLKTVFSNFGSELSAFDAGGSSVDQLLGAEGKREVELEMCEVYQLQFQAENEKEDKMWMI